MAIVIIVIVNWTSTKLIILAVYSETAIMMMIVLITITEGLVTQVALSIITNPTITIGQITTTTIIHFVVVTAFAARLIVSAQRLWELVAMY